MDSNLLLIKCITLLYLESTLEDSNLSSELATKIIDTLDIEDSSMGLDNDNVIIVYLRNTILLLLNNRNVSKNNILQKVKLASANSTYIYDALYIGLEECQDEDSKLNKILELRHDLRKYIADEEATRIISKAFKEVRFNGGKQNLSAILRDLTIELEPYTTNVIDDGHPSIVNKVNLEDSDGLAELLERSIEESSDDGKLITGWQAVNRMLGGGFRRGELAVVGALPFNFKTGFTLNIFKHLALYNKPCLRNPKKKPLIVHISLENELPMNLMWLYINLKENETGVKIEQKEVDVKEAVKYVTEKLQANGFRIEMYRLDPSLAGVYDIIDILTKHESEGYEIHSVVCDYLNMLSRKDIDNSGPMGTNIRAMYRIIRNYCAPRGIFFITPHQLSTEAKKLNREDIPSFVKEIANKGYYDGSKQIDQEIDLEIIIHIEVVKRVGSFLTLQRGKHRKVEITPENDLYCVLPFKPIGGILDDINSKDSSSKSVGGSLTGDDDDDLF